MLKKILWTLLILAIVLGVGASFFQKRKNKMTQTVSTEFDKIGNVELSRIPDGVYSGEFGDFLVKVNLSVRVQNQRIETIEIVKQDGGKGYEALETIPHILKDQQPKVDVVTGATGSSKCIMIAVYRALKSAEQ